MTTLAEIERATERLEDDELLRLEEHLAKEWERRGGDAPQVTRLSDRDRDLFLRLLDEPDCEPSPKLVAAAHSYLAES